MNGVERIAAERHRQVTVEGWDPEHDDTYDEGQLARAAVCYAAAFEVLEAAVVRQGNHVFRDPWPASWAKMWDKRLKHKRIRQLEIAGALIAAEIDRLLRLEETKKAATRVLPTLDR